MNEPDLKDYATALPNIVVKRDAAKGAAPLTLNVRRRQGRLL